MVSQCCAFNGNKRCENQAEEHNNHCEIHYGPAIKLCDVAYNLDLNKFLNSISETIKYLMECYKWLNMAFDARMEHRKIAFVPECYDAGHDYQFVFIKNKILECERLICELNLKDEQNKRYQNNCYNVLEMEECREIVKYEPIENVTEVIMRKNRERQKIEEDVEEIMERYRKENEKILEKRLLLQRLIINYIGKVLDKYNQNKYIMYVAVLCIIREVERTGYFFEKFKPAKCCHDCGHYVSIPFILGCKCIFNYENFGQYLYCDFLKLYFIFQDETFLMDLEVIWKAKLNRLILRERTTKKEEKHSKFLAKFRLKKKILERQGFYDDLSDSE
jgi:hypothetical protein